MPGGKARIANFRAAALGAACVAAACIVTPAAAEDIKIGVLKTTGVGSAMIAADKGYFAAENLKAEIVVFDTSEMSALASGAVDFQLGGVSAGAYNLAGQGLLRIIAGAASEHPGFHGQAYIVANRAWAEGLRSFKDFPGRSVAIPFVGSSNHYALNLLGEKYGFDLKSMTILATQSNPNVASSVAGGRTDAGILAQALALQVVDHGDGKLLGWVGDETPWQLAVVWTSAKTANEHPDTVARFLRAYRRGMQAYHDAFIGPDERRRDGPGADEAAAIIAKYTGLSVDLIKGGIGYDDAQARLDVNDVRHQIAWYKSQGMVRPDVDAEAVIDKRYVIPLPQP